MVSDHGSNAVFLDFMTILDAPSDTIIVNALPTLESELFEATHATNDKPHTCNKQSSSQSSLGQPSPQQAITPATVTTLLVSTIISDTTQHGFSNASRPSATTNQCTHHPLKKTFHHSARTHQTMLTCISLPSDSIQRNS